MNTVTFFLFLFLFLFIETFSQTAIKKPIQLQNMLGDLQQVTEFKNGELCAWGTDGLIMFSSDGGNSWRQPFQGYRDKILNIVHPQGVGSMSSYLALVPSATDNILRSTNNGESWHSTNAPPDSIVQMLTISNSSTILLLDYKGVVYISTDNCNTFSKFK